MAATVKAIGTRVKAGEKALLRSGVKGARAGLAPEVFRLVSSLTPLVNVDLLIKDKAGRTLLTWRDDGHWAPGWHIPGGIIRFKERVLDRLAKTAAAELGCKVKPGPELLAHKEFIHRSWEIRAHFISLLYKCELAGRPDPRLKFRGGKPRPGQWAWHDGCPKDLISVHEVYRQYI